VRIKLPGVIVLLLFTIQTAANAQGRTVFPPLEPDPQAFEYHRLGEREHGYSWTELAEISLWASGGLNAANLNKIRRAVETLHNSPDMPDNDKDKAEYILNFIHKNIFKSYSLYQTRVDTIFFNGRYNCVSSAVLYMIFCTSAGINTSGVMTKEHAFITVHVGGGDIDVETTNPYGFDPGNRREFRDELGKLTGFAYVPAQNYRDRQAINQIELVSLIINNRIADHERQNRYGETVPLAINRTALLAGNSYNDPNHKYPAGNFFNDPYTELLDRLFNYGGSLLKAGREEDCLLWAAAAAPRFPAEDRWKEFTTAAVNNRVSKFIKDKKTADGRNFLESHKTLLSDAQYAQFDSMLLNTELSNRASQIRSAGDSDAFIAAVEQARGNHRIDEKKAVEMITFAVQKAAAALSAAPARDWRAAIRYIEDALARFGANSGLEQTLRSCRSNMATDYHNRFAAEWNKRNFDGAERILNEGLAEFPADRRLLADRETVDKQRSRL
jgi:hypothetical protein